MLNMLVNILQKACGCALHNNTQIFTREAHVFNRAILKTKVRCHFPKPREVKRIKVHGWDTRMATESGRRVLMNRILKGRHVLSH